jgi:hypothetical protein
VIALRQAASHVPQTEIESLKIFGGFRAHFFKAGVFWQFFLWFWQAENAIMGTTKGDRHVKTKNSYHLQFRSHCFFPATDVS